MGNPIVHFEIRSNDPDASRAFYGALFEWKFPEAVLPAYTYVDSGSEGMVNGGIGATSDGEAPLVTVFAAVDDVDVCLARAEELGARTVQPPVEVEGAGVTFALLEDPQGQIMGIVRSD